MNLDTKLSHSKQEIQIVHSNRKTISLEVKRDGQIILRCPYGLSDAAVRRFLAEKQAWLEKTLKKVNAYTALEKTIIPEDEIQRLTREAKEQIPPRVAYWAGRIGVTYGTICIRHQKTRWGSCSQKGNLNFNCLLMQMPKEILDYVIVHELCHRKEMNHSPKFWAEVEKIMPDYRWRRKWLKEHGTI